MEFNNIQVPTTNIRIEGFIQPILKMRMEFSENMPAISKNLYMPDESSENFLSSEKAQRKDLRFEFLVWCQLIKLHQYHLDLML